MNEQQFAESLMKSVKLVVDAAVAPLRKDLAELKTARKALEDQNQTLRAKTEAQEREIQEMREKTRHVEAMYTSAARRCDRLETNDDKAFKLIDEARSRLTDIGA